MTAADAREVTTVPDLHTALEAAITLRLEVARAATPGPWQVDGPWWHDGPGGAEQTGLVTAGPLRTAVLLGTPPRPLSGSPEQVEADVTYAALHDPDDAVRRHERDLRVLERHAELPDSWGSCRTCLASNTNRHGEVLLADWPCVDFRDLLDVYPEVTR